VGHLTRPITLRDVAAAAGVSHGTASNVFSRPDLVREEVRTRVHTAAQSLGYAGPSPRGRLLRSGKANAIGFVADQPLDYFFSDPWARRLLIEVSQLCDARGAGLALVSVTEERTTGWNIESALVDGFLLSGSGREFLIEMSHKRGLPFVSLSLNANDPDLPAICIDDFGGAYAAARHVLDLGHTRIAALGFDLGHGPGPVAPEDVRAAASINVRERARGYWAALAMAGIPENRMPIHAIRRSEGGHVDEVMATLFADRSSAPTALLAMSDHLALGAMAWLQARGVRVPDDVSVVGFDGVPQADLSTPSLTTMEQPYKTLAERAVAAILDGRMPAGREVLPLALIVRDSTGRAPSEEKSRDPELGTASFDALADAPLLGLSDSSPSASG
jgi:DNA-binding LacI/PurR family transcriptional regulator